MERRAGGAGGGGEVPAPWPRVSSEKGGRARDVAVLAGGPVAL